MSGPLKRKAADSKAVAPKKARSIASFFSPPSTSSSLVPASKSSPVTVSKFDKVSWISKLSDEQKSLLRLEIDTMHDSWLGVLKDELITPEFLSLKRFLQGQKEQGKTIYPPEQDIYSWTRFTPLETVKVVILGQDPYHGPNQAMGLSFSVRPPTPAPPSLRNIYKALKKDYPSFCPPPNNGGLLIPWAAGGVLMLNACLTVRAGEANSHQQKGWERFTQRAIEVVAQKRARGVVFMAWGNSAAQRVQKIDKKKHLVLNSVHPSPLSASRGFFDCGHFKKANEWLELRYGEGNAINWSFDSSDIQTKNVTLSDKANDDEEEEDIPTEEELSGADGVNVKDKGAAGVSEDEFDADEEEAMVLAAMQSEKCEQQGKNGTSLASKV